jgi:GT2 family glycosyltransferase
MSSSDKLGVVVLTHGPEGEYGPLVLQLLEQQVEPGSIVIVQNPVDPSDPPAQAPDPGVEVLRTPRNLAYAGGMNTGIRHHLEHGASRLLLLTQDVRLRPGAIDTLLRAGEDNPEYGVLGPLLWLRDEVKVFSYGGRRGGRGGWVAHILDGPPQASNGIAECDWADGAALLVRREVFERVGLIDERFFIYFEETDLCLRATRAGWRVGVALEAAAEQESGQPARPGFHAYLISRNGYEYARRSSGVVGVAAALRRSLIESAQLLRSYRAATAADRSATRIKLAGMWLGLVDFLRRRFGPPPESVSRLGRQNR